VAAKNGKRATTFLLPIPVLLAMAQTWDQIVRARLLAAATWYAPISAHWGGQSLAESSPGKNRHQVLDKRLRKLFDLAGLPYKSAYKFRHGHAVYGLQHAQTMADYKAISMNLMHEDIKITDEIYAPILSNEVKDRISRLNIQPSYQTDPHLADVLCHLSNAALAQLMRLAAQRLSA
jgi:integrase